MRLVCVTCHFPNILPGCWGIFFVVWLLAALSTKRTISSETAARRFRYLIPVLIGWFLLFRGRRLPSPFSIPIIPQTDAILVVSSILCVSGLGLCLWARAVLGRNWSGTVTLKENHELIVRGPYRLVRHPIYTGLLAMVTATAIQLGHIAGMIALILVFMAFGLNGRRRKAANHFLINTPPIRTK